MAILVVFPVHIEPVLISFPEWRKAVETEQSTLLGPIGSSTNQVALLPQKSASLGAGTPLRGAQGFKLPNGVTEDILLSSHLFQVSSLGKRHVVWSGALVSAKDCYVLKTFGKVLEPTLGSLTQRFNDVTAVTLKDFQVPSPRPSNTLTYVEEPDFKRSDIALLFSRFFVPLVRGSGFRIFMPKHRWVCDAYAYSQVLKESQVAPKDAKSEVLSPLPGAGYVVVQGPKQIKVWAPLAAHVPRWVQDISPSLEAQQDGAQKAWTALSDTLLKEEVGSERGKNPVQTFEVIKQEGRWVYIRGALAQGLRIGDRLLVEGQGSTYTLHVIHYHPVADDRTLQVSVALVRDRPDGASPLKPGTRLIRDSTKIPAP